MATSPNQGIMGLQEDYFSKGMLPPEMGLEVADGIMQNLDPQLPKATADLMSSVSAGLSQLTDDELDIFIQLVQQLYDEPESYAQNRAELISGGDLTEEDLPLEYDPEALSMLLLVLRKEQQSRSKNMMPGQGNTPPMPMAGAAPEMMQPPQGFARGGIAEAARIVAGSGRNGDTMLAHITPREARLLRRHGGSGTINPATGLREYGFFSFLKKAWNAVWQPVKKVLNTTVGKIISQVALNILIPGFGSIIASGLQTAAAGGNFGDIVKSMAISGATSFLSGGLAKQGFPSPIQNQLDSLASGLQITTDVGKAALNQGVVTTGMGLVQGQNLKDAATAGITAAATVQAADFGSKLLTPQAEPRIFREEGPAAPIFEGGRRVGGGNFDVDLPGEATRTPDISSDYSVKSNVGVPAYASSSGTTSLPSTTSDGLGLKVRGSTFAPDIDSSVSSARVMPPANYNLSAQSLDVDPMASSGAGFKGSPGVSTATTPYEYPAIGKSVGQIFSDDPMTGLKNTFMPEGPTVSQVMNTADYKNAVAGGMDPKTAFTEVSKKLEPGLLRTYGPGAAAGLGIMAMSGAFTPPGQEDGPGANGPEFRGPTGADLLKANPNEYMIQGMPSVSYNSNDPNRRYTMPDIAVASNYYDTPRYAYGGEVGHYAEGGIPMGGIPRLNPNSLNKGFTIVPLTIMGKKMNVGVPNFADTSITLGGMNGIAAKLKAKRDAEAAAAAAAAAQAAALAEANRPGKNNAYFAGNSEQYGADMSRRPYRQYTREDVVIEPRGKGIAGLSTGGYPRKTGQISGPGTATSDSIPAMLSDGEFVMTAKAVRGLGKGSRREGAKRMYALMHQLERNAARG
jgi:hypothetical protein